MQISAGRGHVPQSTHTLYAEITLRQSRTIDELQHALAHANQQIQLLTKEVADLKRPAPAEEVEAG